MNILKRGKLVPIEAADIVERLIAGKPLYAQEWNDFIETPQANKIVEKYRKRCYELDPDISRPGPIHDKTSAALEQIINRLRGQ